MSVACSEFIAGLPLPQGEKSRLLGLTPGRYLGFAPQLACRRAPKS